MWLFRFINLLVLQLVSDFILTWMHNKIKIKIYLVFELSNLILYLCRTEHNSLIIRRFDFIITWSGYYSTDKNCKWWRSCWVKTNKILNSLRFDSRLRVQGAICKLSQPYTTDDKINVCNLDSENKLWTIIVFPWNFFITILVAKTKNTDNELNLNNTLS